MKNNIYITALVILVGFGSCKRFLDGPQPKDTLAPGTYYQTADQLDLALKSVYDVLQSSELYRTDFHYLKGWEADEGFARASNFDIYINSNTHTASTGDVLTYWRELYKGIGRANTLIANMDRNTSIEQSFRDRIRGEALFLRGYYYFLLVQSYGGVPLVTEPVVSISNTDLARSTDAEIYAQVLKDMTAAEPLVPNLPAIGFNGRISKSAVRGILARVCLSMAGKPLNDVSKYVEAQKWAKMVMDDAVAGHRLNPSYSDIFIQVAADKYDLKESLWEVEFSGNGAGTYASDAGQVGYNSGAAQAAPVPATATSLIGTAPAYIQVTADMYNAYKPGDVRKGWNIQNYTIAGATAIKTFRALPTTEGLKYALPHAKWRREYEVVEPRHGSLTPQNFAILRYADVLLMFAEAENAINGPTPAAYDAVNLVRRRAYAIGGIKTITITDGGTGYTTAPTVTFAGTGGAAATATVSGGRVTAVTLTRNAVTDYNFGTYTTPPAISFAGTGTGAAATATLFTTADADVPPGLSKVDFLTFLQEERMRELCFESLRKFDLIRWGLYVSTMQNASNKALASNLAAGIAHVARWYGYVTDKFLLLPIPSQEIINNKLLVQNPGWN